LSSKDSLDQLGIKNTLLREFDILAIDFRGHKQSGMASTCGGDEVLDLHSAIQYARMTGYRKIILLGVGMGGVTAIREAALFKNVDAVIAVNPCGQPQNLKPWWWNLTSDISLTTDYGRIPIRIFNNTRIDNRYWNGSPVYLVDQVSPIPLLLIYDKSDRYLNFEQVSELYDKAREPKKLLTLSKLKNNKIETEVIINWIKESLLEKLPIITNSLVSSPIQIKEISLDGDILLPEDMIKETIKSSVNEKLDIDNQLSYIKKSIEDLYHSRGYTIMQVSDIHLSPDGKLSLHISVNKIDHIDIYGNRYISSKKIQDLLGISEGYYYNAWEIEFAVKRLNQIPIFSNVESQLKNSINGDSVRFLVKERNPLSLSIAFHSTEFDQFGGLQFSLNEYHQNALKMYGRVLIGIQHFYPIGQLKVQREGFYNKSLSVRLSFEKFFHSWDNTNYFFARQEAEEIGGGIDFSYKITDNTKITTEFSKKHFNIPDEIYIQSKDKGFINALSLHLGNQGRVLRRGEYFFNWQNQVYLEFATKLLKGDYSYKILQLNLYPQIVITPKQILSLNIHWGGSSGNIPGPRLFSLGGDTTLPGYVDDAFIGKSVFLLRSRYELKFGRWLNETSRLYPFDLIFLLDIGDIIDSNHKSLSDFKYESGFEIDYASAIRIGFVKSLGRKKSPAHVYFGWNTHLIRPQL
jgi:hemolysin activation/secretion protein